MTNAGGAWAIAVDAGTDHPNAVDVGTDHPIAVAGVRPHAPP